MMHFVNSLNEIEIVTVFLFLTFFSFSYFFLFFFSAYGSILFFQTKENDLWKGDQDGVGDIQESFKMDDQVS